jgi:predicted metal-dependent hydrolase
MNASIKGGADIISHMTITEQRSITLRGKNVAYQLKESTRSTRVRITVSQNGVALVTPVGFPPRQAEAFLLRNADWVLQQLEKHQKLAAKTQRNTLPPDVILYEGAPTQVVVVEETQRKSRARVDAADGRLIVRVPAGASAAVPAGLEAYLRGIAKQKIEAEVVSQAQRMHVRPSSIIIRDQKTRWGSCSGRGTLSFNWRLIMVPPAILQYVVVHELAHMVEPNHSPDFWSVVARYFPACKEARSWLRRNAALLHPQILP